MKTLYVVMAVRPWSRLKFTSNHPTVAAMVEHAETAAPIPGSIGFMPVFGTFEEAKEFADTGAAIHEIQVSQPPVE